MKKTVKIFTLAFGALVLLVLVLAASLWFFPGAWINSANLARLQPLAAKRGIRWHGSRSDLAARSLSFSRKELELHFDDFCLSYSAEQAEVCLLKLDLLVAIDVDFSGVKKIHLSQITLVSEKLGYDASLPKTEDPQPPAARSASPWVWLDKILLGRLDIRVGSFTLITPDDETTAALNLSNPLDSSMDKDFTLRLEAKSKLHKAFVSASLGARSAPLRTVRDALFPRSAQLRAELSGQQRLSLDVSGENRDLQKIRLGGQARYLSPAVKVQADFRLAREARHLDLSTQGSVRAAGQTYFIKNCDAKVDLGDSAKNEAFLHRGSLLCQAYVRMADLVKEKRYLPLLPPRIDAVVRGHVAAEGARQDLKGSVELAVGPFSGDFLKGQALAAYQIDLGKENTGDTLVDASSQLQISDFRKFARVANGAGLLIPSPINVLNGTVSVDLKGGLRTSPLQGELKVGLITDLSSPQQALDLKANGALKFQACHPPEDVAHMEVDLVATDMKIKLPNIDYKKPPAITPDARFVSAEQLRRSRTPRRSGCAFDYSVTFRNLDRHPLFVSGPFLKHPLPLSLNVKAVRNEPVRGSLKVRDFSTELFRRKTTVQSFDLDLDKKIVEGHFRVDYSEYKIFINLTGTTKNVRMDFQSDPPLDRQQVLAILLFGKKLEGLDESQSGSIENMDAAAKDGALSLASLYLFASTPIESVGYNPHTNGLTAKVKLASGTTLNVGANEQGVTDVGVTKRVSKHWRIQTTVNDPSEEDEASASTLLEWFNSF